jgi:hypothetical protein
LAKLSVLKVKVHTLYLDDYAKSSFEEIARRTGGTSSYFDVKKSGSEENLLNLLVPNILKMIGEANEYAKLGQKMAEDYMKMYM